MTAEEVALSDAGPAGDVHEPESNGNQECEEEELSASELKRQGNEAYQQDDVKAAVELWNRAIRKHVHGSSSGGSNLSILSNESRLLERSIYLNLAQGYLKLGEPARALRACQVVLHEHRDDVKAQYRAAEACLALRRFDEANERLAKLQELDPKNSDATRLLHRVRAEQRIEAKQGKELAKKMWAQSGVFSEGRQNTAERQPLAHLGNIDPTTVALGTGVAGAAAEAAMKREARLAASTGAMESSGQVQGSAADGQLQAPEEVDTEAFRARIMARSQRYTNYVDRSRKQREGSGRSVRLQWLRHGRDADAFDAFVAPLQQELHNIEVQGQSTAADAESTEQDAESPDAHSVSMAEMD